MARKREFDDERQPGRESLTEREDEQATCSRRDYIGVSAALLSPIIGTTRAVGTTEHGVVFPTVVDAIADLGLDPTGAEPVGERLRAVSRDTLVEFPDGVYRFEDGVRFDGRQGFRAVGEDVRLVAPPDRETLLLDGTGSQPVLVDGLLIDQREPGAAAGLRLRGRRVIVRNIGVRGSVSRRRAGLPLLDVASREGQVRIEDLRTDGQEQLGRTGVVFPPAHSGQATVAGADVRGFESAGLATIPGSGPVTVRGSTFRDNAIGIRLGGPGAVEQCEVTNERVPAARPGSRSRPYLRNGITVGGSPATGKGGAVRISETTVRMGADTAGGAGVVVASTGKPVELVDASVETQAAGRAALLVRRPGSGRTSGVRVRESTIRGSDEVDTAINLSNADGSRIIQSTISSRAPGTDAVLVRGGEGVTVASSNLIAGDRAIVAKDSRVNAARLGGLDSDQPATVRKTSGSTTLAITGTGTPARYEITATGDVTQEHVGVGGYGATGTTAEGLVETDTVQYEIRGVVTQFSIDGPADVSVDGEPVEPAAVATGTSGRLQCQSGTTYRIAARRIWTSRDRTGRLSSTVTNQSVSHSFQGPVRMFSLHGTGSLWIPSSGA